MKNSILIIISGYLLVYQGLNAQGLDKNTKITTKSAKGHYKMPSNITKSDYLSNTIILKVKSSHRNNCMPEKIEIASLNKIFNDLDIEYVKKKYPNHQPPSEVRNKYGEKLIDITLIYELKYKANISVETAINSLYSSDLFEYVEPYFLAQPLSYTPNDTDITSQFFLATIKAYDAWDLSKGDTNIVIGITDTGTDWDHPDLEGNIKYNYNDLIDGMDNDGDGYIDNYRGWDLGMNDNDPTIDGSWSGSGHGAHVSGCAAAVTDNTTGVASPGFKCKFLPVKISNTSGILNQSYEGITYAADHGCQIINCSWGSVGGYSQYGQDIVSYATINKSALVIAAAGNDGNEDVFYPASYKYVLSVAATDSQDYKKVSSSYGVNIDVSAPGEAIYSTRYNDTYLSTGGTSTASPVVAGAAAIVRSYFSTYTPMQVGEQLRVTSDQIDTISANIPYKDLIGKGRINLYRALTETSPAVRMSDLVITDGKGNSFTANDTISITGIITNYLAATSNLTITLSSQSAYISMIDSTHNVGALGTLSSTDNNSDPFTVKINSAPLNSKILFRLTFTDGTYNDFQMFEVSINIDYINIAINDVATTITSKGRLGYNETAQTDGIGFTYKGEPLFYAGGLMIASTDTSVSDNYSGATLGQHDSDFRSVLNVKQLIPSVTSEFDVYGKFDDSLAGTSALNVLVTHKAFAWTSTADKKYIIVEYSIKNNGANSLDTIYAGIIHDWDVWNYANNRASVDATNKMGYVYSTDTSIYAAIKLLSSTPFLHYAIDNIVGGGGGIDLSDGFAPSEKYTALSTNKTDAGTGGMGNDVADVVSTGPFMLNPGDSVLVAFALIGGDSLSDIQASAIAAQTKYDNIITAYHQPIDTKDKFYLNQNIPNPASTTSTISFSIPEKSVINLNLYNLMGQKVLHIIENEHLMPGEYQYAVNVSKLNNGIYYYRLFSGDNALTKKMIIVK